MLKINTEEKEILLDKENFETLGIPTKTKKSDNSLNSKTFFFSIICLISTILFEIHEKKILAFRNPQILHLISLMQSFEMHFLQIE